MTRATPQRTWAIIALIVYVLAVAVVVLAPFSFASAVGVVGDWIRYDIGIAFFGSGWIEFAANIAMFMPLGFLLTLLFRHPWYGVVLALVLSAGAEVAQFVIPAREPSLRDVLANTLGAGMGALLAWTLILRKRPGRLATGEAAASDTV